MGDHKNVDHGGTLGVDAEQRPRSSSTYLNLDANKVLTAFGKFGRYQVRMFTIILLNLKFLFQMLTYFITNSVHLFFAATMMTMPLITEEPKFSCKITPPENEIWVSDILYLVIQFLGLHS